MFETVKHVIVVLFEIVGYTLIAAAIYAGFEKLFTRR